jgi:hypothetical protein
VTGTPRRSVALLLACSVGLGGCSFMSARPPPSEMIDPARPSVLCTQSLAPLADGLIAVGFLALAVSSSQSSDSHSAGAYVLPMALVGAFTASTAYGFWVNAQCDDLQTRQALCRQGQQAACRTLKPGYQAGKPSVVPLLCVADAECGQGQRCHESACVPIPVPGGPGPASPPGTQP